jgi:predicted PurR-regulated permease PerM
MYSVRILAVLAVAVVLYFANAILIPAVTAGFLFFLLDPLVGVLEKRGLSRSLSSVVLVIFSVVITGLLLWVLYGAIADITKEIPSYSKKIQGVISEIQRRAAMIQNNTSSALPPSPTDQDVQKVQVVGNGLGSGLGEVTGFALRGIGTILSLLTTILFVPLLSLFMLLEKKEITPNLARVLGRNFDSDRASKEISRMLKGFFLGNLMIGLLMAALLILLFSLLHIKNPVSLGLISGFLNLVPVIGPFVSMILPISAALLQFSTASPFIIIVASIIVLHFSTANFIVPKFVGAHVNINATASTISILFWGFMWGAVGVLFAIPLTALIRIFLENSSTTFRLSRLLAGYSSKPS